MSKKTPKNKKPKTADGELDTSVSSGHESRDGTLSVERLSPHFSPVKVSSPNKGHRGGQLTGLPRKVKDTCADWHNYILEWDSLNTTGTAIISQISNTKIAASSEQETDIGGSPDLRSVLPPGLVDLCAKLKAVYVTMERIVTKMAAMTSALKGVSALDSSQHDDSFTGHQAAAPDREFLFQTWPTHMFYETSAMLHGMYERELAVKRCVMESVAHSRDRDTLMMYSAVWLHQPYIEHDMDRLLEGMLHETGLR